MLGRDEKKKLHRKFEIGLIIFFTVLISGLLWLGYKKFSRHVPQLYTPMFENSKQPLNYSLIPNWSGRDHGVSVSSNEIGVRDISWSKRSNEKFRVLFIGDSQTFGVSVEFDKIFPQLVAKRLSDIDVGTYSAGVPGWNAKDEFEFGKFHWSKVNPDLVVMLLIENDLDSAIDAGPSHQLMAPKRALEPFYRVFDPWSLEAFTMAYINDKTLSLNFDSAMKEAGRLDPYENLFLYGISRSGQNLYASYAKSLRSFKQFTDEKKSKLLILVDSRSIGGLAERSFSKIFDDVDVDYIFLNQWIGNADHYQKKWSNLPFDSHGNEAYHELLASITINYMKQNFTKKIPLLEKVEANVPEKIDPAVFMKMQAQVKQAESNRVESIGPTVDWNIPTSQKQVLAIGGDLSQTRLALKSNTEILYLHLTPQYPIGNECAVWLDLPDFKGFSECAISKGSIWVQFPNAIKPNQIEEVGFVAGSVRNGLFSEIFPMVKATFSLEPPENLLFKSPSNLLIPSDGLYADAWVGKNVKLMLFNTVPGKLSTKFKISGHSYADVTKYPITIRFAVNGQKIATYRIKKWGAFEWSFETAKVSHAQGEPIEITMDSDKIFIPAKQDKSNPDIRELSFLLKNIEIK